MGRHQFLIAFFLTGINFGVYAVPVSIYVQNIQAANSTGTGVCQLQTKKDAFINYIKKDNSKFDFIATQEYDGPCGILFNRITDGGVYSMVQPVGDSTLFYNKNRWELVNSFQVNTTFNKPDKWGHDGSRKAVIAQFRNIDHKNINIWIGNAHLCVGYESSQCYGDERVAHQNDLVNLIGQFQGTPWVLVGDMNEPAGLKAQLINYVKNKYPKSVNVDNLNNQNFDMAIYSSGITGLTYTNTVHEVDYKGEFSDHNGFRLNFNLE